MEGYGAVIEVKDFNGQDIKIEKEVDDAEELTDFLVQYEQALRETNVKLTVVYKSATYSILRLLDLKENKVIGKLTLYF
jgi:hypothetical protein